MFEALVIDNIEFARQNERLSGSIEIAAMPRLHDLLADTAGRVEYRLAGHVGRQGNPMLECAVTGVLLLVCQRCLQPLSWPVDLRGDLEIVSSDADGADDGALEDAPDQIDADPRMDVHALVEDELLLALPLSPRHAPGQCRMQAPEAIDPATGSRLARLGELMRQRTDNDTKE